MLYPLTDLTRAFKGRVCLGRHLSLGDCCFVLRSRLHMLVRCVPGLKTNSGGRLPACSLSLPAPMVRLVAWLHMI